MEEMEMNNDCWSLIAVVRECSRKAKLRALAPPCDPKTAPTSASGDFDGSFSDYSLGSLSADVADSSSSFDQLNNSYKPFMVHSVAGITATNGINSIQQKQQQQLPDQLVQNGSFQNHCINKKKNKYEERRVCRLSVKELSFDKWAWRKYGQKPIKGSPYPRNYYRCSSFKGCAARKQVERSPVDPNIYVVTYTGHHHHHRPPLRNSGGNRVKLSVADPPDHPGSPETGSAQNRSESGSGDAGDDGTNYDDTLITNSELLMGMEKLMKGESEKRNGNEIGLGVPNIGSDPVVIWGPNGLRFGIHESDSYSPTTPAVAHQSPNGQ